MKIVPRVNSPGIGFRFESNNYYYTIIGDLGTQWKLKGIAKCDNPGNPCQNFGKDTLKRCINNYGMDFWKTEIK